MTAVSDVLDPAGKARVILARKAVVTFQAISRVREQSRRRGANEHRHGGLRRLRSGPGCQQRAAGGFHPEEPGGVPLARDAAVQFAREQGLTVHLGHGLTYRNAARVAAIPGVCELNIGHSIVARAVFVGFEQAVREMKALINSAGR